MGICPHQIALVFPCWHCMECEVMEMYDGFIQLFASEVIFVTACSDGRVVALNSCQSENREGSLP